jgi:hypothetical protein
MVETVSSAIVDLTSATTTRAPSSANRIAIARPIPLAEPVTTATRSFKRRHSVLTIAPSQKRRLLFFPAARECVYVTRFDVDRKEARDAATNARRAGVTNPPLDPHQIQLLARLVGVEIDDKQATTLVPQVEPHFALMRSLDGFDARGAEPAGEFRLAPEERDTHV